MQQDIEILTAARDLISNPARWTQHEFAKDEAEIRADTLGSDAVCWCALGAIEKITDSYWAQNNTCFTFLINAAEELYRMDVASVNDTLGHEAILAVYDRAIELAQE